MYMLFEGNRNSPITFPLEEFHYLKGHNAYI